MKKLQKPEWIRIKFNHAQHFAQLKNLKTKNNLKTVCEEAKCPNIGECFGRKTASFMILGNICTRRCPFCNVAHGKPLPVDLNEAHNLANIIFELKLKYVVLTSVDRDDLKDGGAQHFVFCMQKIKEKNQNTKIEILTPDFRGRLEKALSILNQNPPDVFNHNLETIPRLYQKMRPGADYEHSLKLLKEFKIQNPHVLTKSGLMLGLGETKEELIQVLKDLKQNHVDFLTLGQYLQPTQNHAEVLKFYHLEEFKELENLALQLGFSKVAAAPMVRSSYWADGFLKE